MMHLFFLTPLAASLLLHAVALSIDYLPLEDSVAAERIAPRQNATYTYWTPPMKSNTQFILTGIPDVDDGYIRPDTGIYEVDMFYTPADTITAMQQLGQHLVCYFSAATAENWRDDYDQFDPADIGKELPDWPGEYYLDIRSDKVLAVIKKRIDLAAQKGCNAIEPDNVDVYSNDNGFNPAIVPDDTVKYLHKLSAYARSLNMSVGIKNCVEILGPIFDDVDFAISEQCVQYQNCTAYANFTTAPAPGKIGKPVFEVEYVNYTYHGTWSEDGIALSPNLFQTSNVDFPGLTNEKLRRALCNLDQPGVTTANPYLKINTVIKTLDLDGFIMFCDGSVQKTKTKDVGRRATGGGKGTKRSWSRERESRKIGGK